MNFTIQDSIAVLELFYRLLCRFYRMFRDLHYRAKRISFYVDDYNKTVTIYKDGHGIITNAFRIKVLDWQKFNMQGLERYFDINETSKKSTLFPDFRDMMSIKKSKRFSEYGFWYQSTADIIQFDRIIQDEKRYKKWAFKIART